MASLAASVARLTQPNSQTAGGRSKSRVFFNTMDTETQRSQTLFCLVFTFVSLVSLCSYRLEYGASGPSFTTDT